MFSITIAIIRYQNNGQKWRWVKLGTYSYTYTFKLRFDVCIDGYLACPFRYPPSTYHHDIILTPGPDASRHLKVFMDQIGPGNDLGAAQTGPLLHVQNGNRIKLNPVRHAVLGVSMSMVALLELFQLPTHWLFINITWLKLLSDYLRRQVLHLHTYLRLNNRNWKKVAQS